MKKILTLVLALALVTALAVPAVAVEQAGPTSPEWITAAEYAVFTGSEAYKGATWSKLLALRAHVLSGALEPQSGTETVLFNQYRELRRSDDPGVLFETGLLSLGFARNAAEQGKKVNISTDFEMAAAKAGAAHGAARRLACLWNARAALWNQDITGGLEGKGLPLFVGAVKPLLADPSFTIAELLNCQMLASHTAEQVAALKGLIFVTLDGEVVHPRSVRYSATQLDTTVPQSRNSRTMVPVRRLAELMGAVVEYDAATRKITVERAGDLFEMTLDSTSALRNGTPFQMDVAPYVENGRTYIPVRYIAEFFGQKVEWRGAQQQVVITEDRAATAPSNVEAWALAMGAVLNGENNADTLSGFGGKHRFGTGPVGGEVSNRLMTTGPDFGRKILGESWGITDQETLQLQIKQLTDCNDTYPAWDLFRVSNLAQWGYLAGYVTYPQALALVEPAARALQTRFSSWDMAYENYLRGYLSWQGEDTAQNVWETPRGLSYQAMKADFALAGLFNDGLFKTGVIALPST